MENNNVVLLETTPKVRINEKWVTQNNKFKDIVNCFPADSKFKNFIDSYSTNGMDHELYQQSFLHVVTETVFYYPTTFISEKTIKPIVNKRPFVIVGPVGSLANLKSLGFKTFSAVWDESYDEINDPAERLIAVIDIIEWVCSKSVNDLQLLCRSMSDVLNYNFDYYTKEFKNNELDKFEKACTKNLEPRYDSV